MDTTPKYVQMCRQAKEIQEQWKKELGDFVYNPNCYTESKIQTIFDGADGEYSASLNHIAPDYPDIMDITWLPRQDQLQEIMGFSLLNFDITITLSEILEDIGFSEFSYCKSMEQLWLAFAMQRKFSKRWNGSAWVAEE